MRGVKHPRSGLTPIGLRTTLPIENKRIKSLQKPVSGAPKTETHCRTVFYHGPYRYPLPSPRALKKPRLRRVLCLSSRTYCVTRKFLDTRAGKFSGRKILAITLAFFGVTFLPIKNASTCAAVGIPLSPVSRLPKLLRGLTHERYILCLPPMPVAE